MSAAFLFGALAAGSLPLGALIGAWLRPTARLTSAVMAFGAGALLAAMSFELVLPAMERGHVLALAIGLIAGGVGFIGLNHLLNGRGAFLRKAATLSEHARGVKRRKIAQTLEELSRIDIFRAMPPEEIEILIPSVGHRRFPAGEIIVRQGEPGDALYIIESGMVVVLREENGRTTTLAHLRDGQTFGEMALLTDERRTASVVSVEPVDLLYIQRADLDRILEASPTLRETITGLIEERKFRTRAALRAEEWKARAMDTMSPESLQPTATDIHEIVRDARMRGTAGFAIWLGSALDGVGESVVIGATTVGAAVSMPLVGGVFLANLPEAMSSAATLRRQGMSRSVICWMWISLVLLAAAFAALGHVLLTDARPTSFSLFEGLAAGAILAMIAQTMLPEAFRDGGGNPAAVLTVIGFLAGILLRIATG